eukprot:TRINITY_DN8272_c0_g1_i11.p1 TRINITY_DN8272_c0_g1~~TRINITY_DN8272_c0_g1_i11.p1  ORF type:complete len:563 (+),score=200.92 TRINITY_DN8272_c0_g1_i11:53-1741(+)
MQLQRPMCTQLPQLAMLRLRSCARSWLKLRSAEAQAALEAEQQKALEAHQKCEDLAREHADAAQSSGLADSHLAEAEQAQAKLAQLAADLESERIRAEKAQREQAEAEEAAANAKLECSQTQAELEKLRGELSESQSRQQPTTEDVVAEDNVHSAAPASNVEAEELRTKLAEAQMALEAEQQKALEAHQKCEDLAREHADAAQSSGLADSHLAEAEQAQAKLAQLAADLESESIRAEKAQKEQAEAEEGAAKAKLETSQTQAELEKLKSELSELQSRPQPLLAEDAVTEANVHSAAPAGNVEAESRPQTPPAEDVVAEENVQSAAPAGNDEAAQISVPADSHLVEAETAQAKLVQSAADIEVDASVHLAAVAVNDGKLSQTEGVVAEHNLDPNASATSQNGILVHEQILLEPKTEADEKLALQEPCLQTVIQRTPPSAPMKSSISPNAKAKARTSPTRDHSMKDPASLATLSAEERKYTAKLLIQHIRTMRSESQLVQLAKIELHAIAQDVGLGASVVLRSKINESNEKLAESKAALSAELIQAKAELLRLEAQRDAMKLSK